MPAGGTPPDPYRDPIAYRTWYDEHLATFEDPEELTEAIDQEASRVMRLKAEQGL
jgi:hypothetical protein